MEFSSTATTIGISSILVFFVLVELESSALESELRQDIYQNITPFCPHVELCEYRGGGYNPSHFGCHCDEQCSVYGDCCRDYQYFVPDDIPKLNFSCIKIPTKPRRRKPMKMVASCPPNASYEEHQLCGTRNETKYLLSLVPITVTEKNVSVIYRNIYCARCNINANASYQLWNTTLVCDRRGRQKPFPEDAEAAWDLEKKRWIYKEENRTLQCKLKMVLPKMSYLLGRVKCYHDFHDQCPAGTDPELARLCKGYTALVKDSRGPKMYKNRHCHICNGGVPGGFVCEPRPKFIPRAGFVDTNGDLKQYSLLLRYARSECGAGELYDGISKECIHLFPPRSLRRENTTLIENCVRAKLSARLYELSSDNDTVIVSKYKRNFTQGQFRLLENGELEICEKDVPAVPANALSILIAVTTLVGFGLSIVFLVLHLCAVLLVAELRNLSGITLASLCLALLGGYTSFLVGIYMRDQPYLWCYICAIVTYYFFMASFFWMLVLAFDVSKVLRASVRKFRAAHGFHRMRFIMYSIIAWGAPLMASFAVHWADSRETDCIWLNPMLGLHDCWFGNTESHIVFFVIPLAVIMLLNFSFFVYATKVTSDTSKCRNLKVYVKLTILLGLNWVGGLLAMALDSDFLWVLFTILNTLQGLFIFLSFTLTPKVSKGLSRIIPCLDKSTNETVIAQNTTDKETSFSCKATPQILQK